VDIERESWKVSEDRITGRKQAKENPGKGDLTGAYGEICLKLHQQIKFLIRFTRQIPIDIALNLMETNSDISISIPGPFPFCEHMIYPAPAYMTV